ncbi:trichohyalin-like isoform X1 [Gambusia affinis]|uniref:trichohyalin-like isoform X1 n=1 Tax=Gambusia affinis TaxID=33528 RepID=UPI001CDC39E9|nr:trichohyalin-like isoform X1 [Gambusia affinis]
MASKKQSRSNEALVTTKINKPVQKDKENELRGCIGGKQNSSSAPRTAGGKSSQGRDSTATGSKAAGRRGSGSHQTTRPTSEPAKPALRLRSSRSFSSLQASSLTIAPFMRSSRSLSRLDERSTEDTYYTSASSQVRKGQSTGKKTLDSGRQSSSVERFTSSAPSSSSVVSTAICHHQTTKEKKQIKDGVYTLCAMTAGMKHNWVQAVFKNVQPNRTQGDQRRAILSRSSVAENEEDELEDCEESHEQELTSQQQLEGTQSPADLDPSSPRPPVSPSSSPAAAPANPPQQVEETEEAQCHPPVETNETDTSISVEGFQSDDSSSTVVLSDGEDFRKHADTETAAEQPGSQGCETEARREEQQVSINPTCAKDRASLLSQQQTGQLVKELQQTQRELSRVQQLNKSLQDELQQEREIISEKLLCVQNDTSSSSEQTLTFQRLQRMNHNLRMELDELKRNQEEAKEAELRRRVDLLAQQAQLLVTGDATALAQMHLEQDRQQFQEQQRKWEHSVTSLKAQLNASEEKRRETESQVAQLQQELQSQQSLQQEAEQLQKHLQEMSGQLRAYEDAQAEKEARLQKHLLLLQASQERERRSLSASLAQAERHSQDLRDKLERAEQQLESLGKTQTWTRQIEEAQQQLQEELAHTVSAVQRLQEERERLDRRCEELQSQLSEADREVGRLQDRLNTEETHYYNLEHSYERACEDLQVALGKVQQRESEIHEIREGYERLLDSKEQELSEVLLKMEVLGNSLEETEVKLSEVMRVCTCSFPQDRQKGQDRQTLEAPNSQLMKVSQGSNSKSLEQARSRSRSVDASCQYLIAAGDDSEKFMSVIQLLEIKLFITEEKLRDITQRLEEQQGHVSCQDPQLCSQLTQSRATAQHLSLLLHSQAKQSQRFAQETEARCRMLVGRFQVALNVVQACGERLQATPVNAPDIERQLAGVACCLQQGEKDAERLQQEARNLSKEEGRILGDEKLAGAEQEIVSRFANTQPSHGMSDVGKYLIKELFVVEKMVSVLQSQNGICELSAAKKEDKVDLVRSYKNLISKILSLKGEERMESRGTGCDGGQLLESLIGRFCAEAELIYAALKLQQQSVSQINSHDQREGLADISPSELSPYDEQTKDSDEAAKQCIKKRFEEKKVAEERERGLLEQILSRLQKRAKFLCQVCQELPVNHTQVQEGMNHYGDDVSEADLTFFQEQVKLMYLSDRLYLDIRQELQQSKASQNSLRDLRKEQELGSVMEEQEALNEAFNQLQDDNCVLREELERAEQKVTSVETGNQKLLEDMQKIEGCHKEQIQKLEAEFQEKIKELQQIHEEEMKQLHGHYSKSCVSKERQHRLCTEEIPICSLSDQAVAELKAQEDETKADGATLREASLKDLEKLQASCDLGLTAMEEMHRKIIKDLQQEHQKQVAELLREKDQLLQEETAATLSAIIAMRRAHKTELERSRLTQRIRESADVSELHVEYEKEIQLLQRELEVLSDQHTKKCLENSQLSQELQTERESVMQYQQENQELKHKQREPEEVTQHPGNQAQSDVCQMEMILRAKEAEMQHLKQEAISLREDLEIARMDKVYAENKLKALHTNNYNEAKFATWSPSRDASGHRVDDSVKNNPAIKKKEKTSFLRQIRGFRSRSLKDGLSTQERMKLFESS